MKRPGEGGRQGNVQTHSCHVRCDRISFSELPLGARPGWHSARSRKKFLWGAGLWGVCENEKYRGAPHFHGYQSGTGPLLSEQSPDGKIRRAGDWRRLSERALDASGGSGRKVGGRGSFTNGCTGTTIAWSMARALAG